MKKNFIILTILLYNCIIIQSCQKENDEMSNSTGEIINSSLDIQTKTSYPRVPTEVEKSNLLYHFSWLDIDNVMILAPEDYGYNCIGYSMGVRKWIDPPKDELSFEVMYNHAKTLYGAETNYIRANRGGVVDGYKDGAQITHASREYVGGRWASKLGSSFAISHGRIELRHGLYGEVFISFDKTNEVIQSLDFKKLHEICLWETNKIIEITLEEKEYVKREISESIDSNLRAQFDLLYMSWKNHRLSDPCIKFSNNIKDCKKLEEFPKLISMGMGIIPLIINSFIQNENENFVGLVLYDELMKDSGLVITYKNDDPAMFESEQIRALRTAKLWIHSKMNP